MKLVTKIGLFIVIMCSSFLFRFEGNENSVVEAASSSTVSYTYKYACRNGISWKYRMDEETENGVIISIVQADEGDEDEASTYIDLNIPSEVGGYKVSGIDEWAFQGCYNALYVTIPDTVTSIGNHAFEGCVNLTSVTMTNSVTEIGECAFEECNDLTDIQLSESVTEIKPTTFANCESLEHITIPSGVTTIGFSAFEACYKLKSIVLPSSVTSIEYAAFSDCMSLIAVIYTGYSSDWFSLTWSMTQLNDYLKRTPYVYFLNESSIISKQPYLVEPDNYIEITESNYIADLYSCESFSYQWYFNDTDNNENGTLIQNATQSTYTPNILGDKYYYCIVTISFGVCEYSEISKTVQVTVAAQNVNWFDSELNKDRYGNTGTEEDPYEIQNNDDFISFIKNLNKAGEESKFNNTYISLNLDEGDILDLTGNDSIVNELESSFTGSFAGNGFTITGMQVGKESMPLSGESLERFQAFLTTCKNITFDQMVVYTRDNMCIENWFNWYYIDAYSSLLANNCNLINFDIYVVESKKDYWYKSELSQDLYGNAGTEGDPYEIRNKEDFISFLANLNTSGEESKFNDTYISINLDEGEILDLTEENSIINELESSFTGDFVGNGCTITGMQVGNESTPLSGESLERFQTFLATCKNITFDQMVVYTNDERNIENWFNWYYMDAYSSLLENNCNLNDCNIYLI